MTAQVVYNGDLRTTAIHIQSGTAIETDAPTDNGGHGSCFSPTDLVATALASCMCTTMALSAKARRVALGDINCEVEKIMAPDPRRISEIKVTLVINGGLAYNDQERSILERAALTCPVYESLHPDCRKSVLFIWP